MISFTRFPCDASHSSPAAERARGRSCVSAFKIAAIAVSIPPPAGPIVIGAVHDLARAPPVVVVAWWTADLATAEAVVDQATAVDLRNGSARSIDAAAVAIVTAARRMGVRLSEHGSVLAARQGGQRGRSASAWSRRRGPATSDNFNTLFQMPPQGGSLEGRRLDYGECRRRFEAALAHVAAGRMAGDPGVTLDVLAMAFGSREGTRLGLIEDREAAPIGGVSRDT